ncbi:MAG: DUF4398 domain-containing protein [Methylococcaceae bacterium]|nr:DUF4398 domain-containing protein [Methylococcaceae bacterium]MDP2393243.1 DUF4398 domain-containing protein [Methylococcaceae bacterium]MDP3019650.1 DUF4398 domain-containing protein [Methylococcaceae bacterium]MDP3389028.1 DUF4398 domain-containing protein [Methylococcaceae bacterium]MDZ4157514.1 DUF4398 domain-containing protein [Methylococcales bacterium]
MNNNHSRSTQIMRSIGVTAVAAVLVAGCASIPAPTEQIAVSKAAVDSATSAGGNEFAPVQLQSALEKLNAAERAMAEEENLKARQLAEQAQVDAQLAAATARAAKAQKAVGELREGNRVLHQEIDRKAQ